MRLFPDSFNISLRLYHNLILVYYNSKIMKFTLALSAVALSAATAAAFTIAPQQAVARPSAQVGHTSTVTSLKMSEALAAQEKFAKSEIESNDVRMIPKHTHTPIIRFFSKCQIETFPDF
jgi:hypothetical protein